MSNTSFREKSAWISFVLIAVLSAIHFAKIGGVFPWGGSKYQLELVLWAVLIVAELVLHLAITIQSPIEARTPKDERERLIGMKATHLAFPVLLVGAFVAIGTLHLALDRWTMAQVILFGIIVAELTQFGAQIVYYRRGL